MATRKDVAQAAGVSPTAVSYYINNNGYVGKKARENIEKAIKELNYRPNLLARSLTSNDSKQIIYICNEIRNPFHAEVANGVATAASQEGYHTMFCNVGDDQEHILNACRFMVSGAVVVSTKLDTDIINKIAAMGIPLVMLENKQRQNLHKDVTIIQMNYKPSVKEFLERMSQQNRKKIGCITTSKKADRLDAKTETLFSLMPEYGLELDENFMVQSAENITQSYELTKKQLKCSTPDVIFCSNDNVALGVMRGVLDSGYSIPEDIAVVGMDNTVYAQTSFPSLSSIDTKPEELGLLSVELILKKRAGENIEGEQSIFTEFVCRESC